jgi:hypothetical protein
MLHLSINQLFARRSSHNPFVRRSCAYDPSLITSTLIIYMYRKAKLYTIMHFTAILCLLTFGPLQPTSIVDFPWEQRNTIGCLFTSQSAFITAEDG